MTRPASGGEFHFFPITSRLSKYTHSSPGPCLQIPPQPNRQHRAHTQKRDLHPHIIPQARRDPTAAPYRAHHPAQVIIIMNRETRPHVPPRRQLLAKRAYRHRRRRAEPQRYTPPTHEQRGVAESRETAEEEQEGGEECREAEGPAEHDDVPVGRAPREEEVEDEEGEGGDPAQGGEVPPPCPSKYYTESRDSSSHSAWAAIACQARSSSPSSPR
ncbi:hypothetical protein LshimejAT787_0906120 [Lyophyllum shimeji]|uniref:Uncharacterized protein n=1 Tax=Lyophyllum shimeji TaxID=47721 RepID=A0A9P3UQL9_LYOSH|nr:hypothetical protein LshimejAT787_0906120 [Lyophyllum shimeji]